MNKINIPEFPKHEILKKSEFFNNPNLAPSWLDEEFTVENIHITNNPNMKDSIIMIPADIKPFIISPITHKPVKTETKYKKVVLIIPSTLLE